MSVPSFGYHSISFASVWPLSAAAPSMFNTALVSVLCYTTLILF